jgi:hypothetical protein
MKDTNMTGREQLRGIASADQAFHRKDLLGRASLIPNSCINTLQQLGTPAPTS